MFTYLGDISGADRQGATIRLRSGDEHLSITFCTPRIVRVQLEQAGLNPDLSYVGPRVWPDTPIDVGSGDPRRVSTSELAVSIAARPLRLSFEDQRRGIVLSEPDGGGMGTEIVGEGSGRRRVQARFRFSDEQHFYGLGHGGAGFDRLGSTRQLWNTQIGHGPGTDLGIPLLVSNLGYGLFFDNSSDAVIAVGRSDGGVQIVYTAEGGPLDWFFLLGGDLRGLMNEIAELLDRAPLPPRWALGFLQSTRHFEDTDELRQLPRTIREKQIPCDGIILLSTYGDALGCNRGVGHLEFQPELWPDPAALIGEIREQHFEVMTHEYPVIHPEAPQFRDAVENGYVLEAGYESAPVASHPNTNYRHGQRYLDFSNPKVRTWWWAQHRELVEVGIGGWWLDGGEGPPATSKLHAGDGSIVHNFYDRFRHQAFAEGEARDRPEQRVFLLCRSGAAGMQRFGSSTWTGDINNDFATLEAQIPLGLNTGISGVPYWGTDVGGFFHPVPETGELYARWFQFGAFSPIFRSHGWVWREHVPWAHGEEIEEICREYAELRYRLMPYTYTLAWQAHTLGLPLMRPLVLNYPEDPRVWQMGGQYLWGDDLLVAPVTREGATTWPVYLPEGRWYDFWTGVRYDGPRGVSVQAPMSRLPLFARAGAIIPMGPVVQHTRERPLDEVTLLIYPESASRFELYEDDGRSNAYRESSYALTPIQCTVENGGVMVRIGEPLGAPSVLPTVRTYVLCLRADRVARVEIDGAGELSRLDDSGGAGPGWWEDGQGFAWVRLPKPSHATIRLEREPPS